MATADELRLRVSGEEYLSEKDILQRHIETLEGYCNEYENLKTRATEVVGDEDSNLAEMQNAVQSNIDMVKQQIAELNASLQMLQTQEEQLGLLSTNVGSIIKDGTELAGQAFKTAKTVGEVVSMVN